MKDSEESLLSLSTRSAEETLELIVQHEHHGGSNGTESVGTRTLEEGGDTLVLKDLAEAVSGSPVHPLLLGLLGLHLQTTTNSVEGVGRVTSGNGSYLCDGELGQHTLNTEGVLEWVALTERIVHTEVYSAVRDDTNNRHSETVVKGKGSLGSLGGLHEAIQQTVEITGSRADIRCKTGTSVIEGVDNGQATSSRETTRCHLDEEELTELLFGVVAREDLLDDVLEGKVEGLGRDISDNVGQVTTPESSDTLLAGHTGEAVNDTSVASELTRANSRIGILGLDNELDTLDRGCDSLGNTTGQTTEREIDQEVQRTSLLCSRSSHFE